MSKDYYEILGVQRNSSLDDIKKAYKLLARKYHPDMGGNEADEEKFKEVGLAYSILSDPDKRKKYDMLGSSAFDGTGGFDTSQGFEGFSGFGGSFDGFDPFEIFSNIMGDDDLFSSFRGFSRSKGANAQSSRRNENLNLVLNIELDFITAAKGGKQEINLFRDVVCNACDGTGSKDKRKSTCQACNGHGRVISSRRTPFGMFSVESICNKCNGVGTVIAEPCNHCKGKGYASARSNITVDIPAGVDNNDVVRVKGAGNSRGSISGDLYLQISVKEHQFFKREGANLYCEIPITYSDAILGTELDIKGIQDLIKLKIPAHTESGTTFRIKGKGLPDIHRRNEHGTLYVKVVIAVPGKASKDYKELIKKLSDLEESTIKKDLRDKYKDYLK